MNPEELAAVEYAVQRLPSGAAPLVLSLLAKVCSECGSLGRIQTSRKARGGGRIAYLTCPGCGRHWKCRLLDGSAGQTSQTATFYPKKQHGGHEPCRLLI